MTEANSLKEFVILNPLNGLPYAPHERPPVSVVYARLRDLPFFVDRMTFAKIYRCTNFPWTCLKCSKETPHNAQTGRCKDCMDLAVGSLRKRARRLGESRYMDTCTTHGRHEFSVNTGKCLGCYTTLGARRRHVQVEVHDQRRTFREMLPAYTRITTGDGLTVAMAAQKMDVMDVADAFAVDGAIVAAWQSGLLPIPLAVGRAFDSWSLREEYFD